MTPHPSQKERTWNTAGQLHPQLPESPLFEMSLLLPDEGAQGRPGPGL